MKKIQSITGILFALILFSCGQSEQEKQARQEAQEQHDDSIKQVAAKLQRQKDVAAANLKTLQQLLDERVADLNIAQSELNDAEGGHWYWTANDQNTRIRQATFKVENIQTDMKNLRERIEKANAIINQ